MGVNRKRNARFRMTQASRDRHDIDTARDQLAGMGMPEGVERDLRHSEALGGFAPVGRDGAWPQRLAFEVGKEQGVGRRLAYPESHPHLERLPAILSQRLDSDVR